MKTIIDISLSILKEYDDWKKSNENWNVSDYLHLKYDMNAAIAFSKLFFPTFLEMEGCIIIDFRYNEETFREWHTYFNGNVKEIEFKCNFYEIKDYFEFKESEYESLELYNQAIDEFSKALKKSWEINLQILFPERKMIVEVWDELDTTQITFFTEKA